MNILNYFIEANICLVFFYLLYRLLLGNETNFAFNRMFLLSAIGLSLVVPFLELGKLDSIAAIGAIVPAHLLPEVTIGTGTESGEVTAAGGINIWSLVISLYFTVAGLLMLRFLYRSRRLLVIIRTAPLFAEVQNARILAVSEPVTTFSIFRHIIISNPSSLTENEKELIIRHEMVHVQQRHTWDIVIAELLCIVFWFNPTALAIKKKLRDAHEFQADQKASEGGDIQEYCSLLARISLQSAGFTLANHFNKSLTIKRINMMKTIKRKISRWKVAVLVPAISGVLAFIACQDQVMNDLNTVALNSSAALDVPAHVQDRYATLSKANPDANYIILELQQEGQEKLKELRQEYGLPSTVEIFQSPGSTFNNAAVYHETKAAMILHETNDSGNDSRVFAILEYTDQVQALSDRTVQDGEIFLVVEETAYPAEGMEKLYQFVTENMSYPSQAKKAGIEGRVFIEFVVEKDGTLTNFKSLKGIGHGCDEEAIRVLAMSPPWKPGLQHGEPVRQKMVMPVTFEL